MRYLLSLLLLCAIFGNSLTERISKKKMVAAMKTVKALHDFKERKRKLEGNTDVSDTETGTTPPTTAAGSLDPNVGSYNMTANETVDTETNTTNTEAKVQIRKFHKFQRKKEEKKITFNVYFYFFGRIISRTIIIRIKITYSKGRILRNLQELEAESVPTECGIAKQYEQYAGQMGNGSNVDYDCEANTTSEAPVEAATLDTDYSLMLDNQPLNFEEINFDTDAAEEAQDITSAKTYTMIGTLENTKADFQRSYLDINGEPKLNVKTLKDAGVNELTLEFIHYTSKDKYIKKNVTCSIFNETALRCPENIRSYLTNISQAKCYDEQIYVSFNVNPEDETGEIYGQGGNTLFRKHSSGLSGGSIAGIVIACVVVLIAASIAAIMLRKPAPPIDSSTVVDLKTTDNI